MGDEGNDQSSSSSASGQSSALPARYFNSLKQYIQETDVRTLDLSNMKLKTPEVAAILELLPASQITELNLSDNDFEKGIEPLPRLLTQTRIEKLNISACKIPFSELISLMEVLKETTITELDVSGNPRLPGVRGEDCLKFISSIVESRLVVLNLADSIYFPNTTVAEAFVHALRKTSLTHLNLKVVFTDDQCIKLGIPLFSELEYTSITHLNLANCMIGRLDLKGLGDSLRNSKLVELDLSSNEIRDSQVDDLFQALIGSKITTLNLAANRISGDNNLGRFLKETRITHLDLSKNIFYEDARMFSPRDFLRDSALISLKVSECRLVDETGAPLMESLRFSKVTELDDHNNHLSEISIKVFAQNVQDISVETFHYSCDGDIRGEPYDEALLLIGELSARSRLKTLHVGGRCGYRLEQCLVVAEFLKKLAHSTVTHFNSWYKELGKPGTEVISQALSSTPITHLNLRYNNLGDAVVILAANLKFTAVTHLNLKGNNINDEGAKILAECLRETRIVDLDLSLNNITCDGATELALFLKDTVEFDLKLKINKIENKGLEALAEHSRVNLITNLDVRGNPGNEFVVVAAILNNRRLVHHLVNAFKRIGPEVIDQVLQPESLANTSDIDQFLDECLRFYETVVKEPSAASKIVREGSVMLSKDEINLFLLKTFPRKFTEFIAMYIEADTAQHVEFLRTVDALGLSKIVELLLLNRAAYTISNAPDFLHPYVYRLLLKYKIPICNLDVDPEGIDRIIQYFTTYTHIEGAADVVSMLQNIQPSCSDFDMKEEEN